MSALIQFAQMKHQIIHKQNSGECMCLACDGLGAIELVDVNELGELVHERVQCPTCHGDGLVYDENFDKKSTLARELWRLVWRAARIHFDVSQVPTHLGTEGFDLMTDSMLVGHALNMTPYQIYELIITARKQLSERYAAPQQTMLKYKLALRNGEVDFDLDLPF